MIFSECCISLNTHQNSEASIGIYKFNCKRHKHDSFYVGYTIEVFPLKVLLEKSVISMRLRVGKSQILPRNDCKSESSDSFLNRVELILNPKQTYRDFYELCFYGF